MQRLDTAGSTVIGLVYPLVISRSAGGRELPTKRPGVGNVEIARRENRRCQQKKKKKEWFHPFIPPSVPLRRYVSVFGSEIRR